MDIVYKRPKYRLKLTIRKTKKPHEYLAIYRCLTCGKVVLRAKVDHWGFSDLRAFPCEHVRDKVFFKRLSMGL